MWRVTNPAIEAFFAGDLAAGLAGARRPAVGRPGRLHPRRRRRRDRPDPEPLALPLPEGDLPRLGHDGRRAVGGADLAGHEQPAADRRGGGDGRHRQPPCQLASAAVMHAFVMPNRGSTGTTNTGQAVPAKPRLLRRGDGADVRRGPSSTATSCAAGRPTARGATCRTPAAGSWTPTSAWRSSKNVRDGQREVPGDPAGGRHPQGLRAAGLRPARRARRATSAPPPRPTRRCAS